MKLNQEALRTAWYGVSFDPEKTAEGFESEYNETLEIFFENVKNADITEEQKAECISYWENRLYNQAMKYIGMQSRCMSAMVVGPAKFPVKSQEKKHNSAMKALDDYLYTADKMTKTVIFDRYMTAEQKQQKIDDVEVVENINDNRLQLFFDGKPEQEMINKLKANGFRWSPKNKAWQRQLTDNARIALKRVLGEK